MTHLRCAGEIGCYCLYVGNTVDHPGECRNLDVVKVLNHIKFIPNLDVKKKKQFFLYVWCPMYVIEI